MDYDVIIIGAGAAGLMAMKELSGENMRICLLEALPVAGGRIATVISPGFEHPIETGAEFIHGDLTITKQLLRSAGIDYTKVKGDMISVRAGKWQKEEDEKYWDEFMSALAKQAKECTIMEFLETHFAEEKYATLRKSVQQFSEGFDLADISKASILAAKEEWLHEDEDEYRVTGGYAKLIAYLLCECTSKNNDIFFNQEVVNIEHDNDSVTAVAKSTGRFTAARLIITVSAGVLQSGGLKFDPALKEHEEAIKQLGFGAVIKFLFQFKDDFWTDHQKNIGFILSDESIPTWWTQLPEKSNILTGWIGGPKAKEKSTQTKEVLMEEALVSLSSLFGISLNELRGQLVAHEIYSQQNRRYAVDTATIPFTLQQRRKYYPGPQTGKYFLEVKPCTAVNRREL